jgi:hypothetical protein
MARIYPSVGSLQNQTNSPNYGILNAPILHMPLQNNLNPVTGVGTVAFNRSSVSSYIDRMGLISYANIDEPRFEKNGLLIEGSSTNLVRFSELFTNTDYWKTYQSTVSFSSVGDNAAPTGVLERHFVLQDNTNNTIHCLYEDISLNIPNNTVKNYTISLFVKKNNSQFLKLTVSDLSGVSPTNIIGSNRYFANVDLENGVFFNDTIQQTNNFFSNSSYAIQEMWGGWYRVSMSFTITTITNTTFPTLRFTINTVRAGLNNLYEDSYSAITGNTNNIFLWGAQLEENYFMSSYIVTESSPVTRTSDWLEIDILNTTINFPTTENTYIFDIDILGTKHNSSRDIFTLDGFKHNALKITSDGNLKAFYDLEGITEEDTLEAFTQHRIALRYDNDTYTLFRNSFKTISKSASSEYATFPSGKINIGSSINLSQNVLNGHITNFRVFDTALTDDEIRIV